MPKQFFRKNDLAARYGVTPRAIEHAVAAGRLPVPHYPLSRHRPLWPVEAIEALERKAAIQAADKRKKQLTDKKPE